MEDKKKLEIFEENERVRISLEKERKESDDKYAIKLTEKIVFSTFAVLGLAVLGALAKVALNYFNGFLQ